MTQRIQRAVGSILTELKARDMMGEVSAIAKRHSVLPGEMVGHMRTPQFVFARHEFWAMLRGKGWSYPRIGAVTGHDHTTVIEGVRQHYRRLVRAA